VQRVEAGKDKERDEEVKGIVHVHTSQVISVFLSGGFAFLLGVAIIDL
jgi:hypothetical protein